MPRSSCLKLLTSISLRRARGQDVALWQSFLLHLSSECRKHMLMISCTEVATLLIWQARFPNECLMQRRELPSERKRAFIPDSTPQALRDLSCGGEAWSSLMSKCGWSQLGSCVNAYHLQEDQQAVWSELRQLPGFPSADHLPWDADPLEPISLPQVKTEVKSEPVMQVKKESNMQQQEPRAPIRVKRERTDIDLVSPEHEKSKRPLRAARSLATALSGKDVEALLLNNTSYQAFGQDLLDYAQLMRLCCRLARMHYKDEWPQRVAVVVAGSKERRRALLWQWEAHIPFLEWSTPNSSGLLWASAAGILPQLSFMTAPSKCHLL